MSDRTFNRLVAPGWMLIVGMSLLSCGEAVAKSGAARLVAAVSGDQREIVSLSSEVVVPPAPPARGTVFVWPGLQPSRPWGTIDNGVLQSVLTWGPSCAPGAKPANYASWWISAQYVNSFGRRPGFTGCHGGRVMRVKPGDQLRISARLIGTTWHQDVRDVTSGESVHFDLSLEGQRQATAFLEVETYDNGYVPAARFDHVAVSFRDPVFACQIRTGAGVSATRPQRGADGRTCYVNLVSIAMPMATDRSGPPGQRSLAPCNGSDRLASVAGGAARQISFRNATREPMIVYWINYEGRRVKYRDVAPGGLYAASTYLGHSWLVTNANGACLGVARSAIAGAGSAFVVRGAR